MPLVLRSIFAPALLPMPQTLTSLAVRPSKETAILMASMMPKMFVKGHQKVWLSTKLVVLTSMAMEYRRTTMYAQILQTVGPSILLVVQSFNYLCHGKALQTSMDHYKPSLISHYQHWMEHFTSSNNGLAMTSISSSSSTPTVLVTQILEPGVKAPVPLSELYQTMFTCSLVHLTPHTITT